MRTGMIFVLEFARNIFAGIGVAFVLYIAWLAILAGPECWFAPKLVKFHQGMTLCPGQSAEATFTLPPLPEAPKSGRDPL